MKKIFLLLLIFVVVSFGQNNYLNDIYIQTARDFEKQYEIVKRNSSAIDACVHASLVAEAWLQANDESNYKKWKRIEEQDCKRAELDFYW